MDHRRRLAVLAGGLAAVGGGLAAFIGHHGPGGAASKRYFLIGLSVGITLGVLLLLIIKMNATRRNETTDFSEIVPSERPWR